MSGEWQTINRRSALSHAIDLEKTRVIAGSERASATDIVAQAEIFRKFLDREGN